MPAWTELSYNTAIADGETAGRRYLEFLKGALSPEEQATLWTDLSAYCGLDTRAMVALLDVLQGKARDL